MQRCSAAGIGSRLADHRNLRRDNAAGKLFLWVMVLSAGDSSHANLTRR